MMEGTDIRLEVAVGAGSPPAVTMRAGEPRAIFSVGFEGSWSIAGEGVLGMHAYFVFDGVDLFVASIDLDRPAMMAGEAVSLAWMQVPVPGEVTLGRAVLRTRYASARSNAPAPKSHNPDSERTQSTGARPPPPLPPRLAQRGQPESERTRFAPVEQQQGNVAPLSQQAMQGPSVPIAAPSAPFGSFASPAPPLAPIATLPSATPPKIVPKWTAFWTDASLPKKIIYVLLPFALLSTLYTLRDDPEPSPSRPRSAPSASSSASSAATTQPVAVTTAATTALPTTTPPTPLPSLDAGTGRVQTPSGRPTPPAGKRTPEREIIDLIAAGSYKEAAKRLDAMAAAQPGHPEYLETARILRAKSGQPQQP